ncbi:hypothetical protein AgCh_014582 [Apium graveolens]
MDSMMQTKTNSQEDEEACLLAMQLATASVLPLVLKAAIELDLLEIIAKAGPDAYVTPNELASMLPTSNLDAPVLLDRILRVLASYSILNCGLNELANGQVERKYGLTNVCKYLIKNVDGVSIAPLTLLNMDKIMMESWYSLKDAVLDGGLPCDKAFGMNVYEYSGTDPRFNKILNHAMKNHSTITMKKILEKYNGFKGVEHVGGDMFVSVPTGDAILLKSICHNWSDEQCLKLLMNCYQALEENGPVIIADPIIPELPGNENATKTAIHFDAIMLAQSPGGRERTEKEFEALAKGAGFKLFNKVCCAFDIWIMEFCK